jgi:hypothetical protein
MPLLVVLVVVVAMMILILGDSSEKFECLGVLLTMDNMMPLSALRPAAAAAAAVSPILHCCARKCHSRRVMRVPMTMAVYAH